ITIAVHDSSGEHSYFKVTRSVLLSKLFSAYAAKKDAPADCFEFRLGGVLLQGERAVEAYAVEN
ncbi:hypothetical protein B484DRAFT_298216, partial [Ochromonadaceae sp. CCMP2298]